MKLFKLFLGIFSVAFAFSGANAMEGKAKVEPHAADQIKKDELRVILKLVLDTIKSSKVTEAELFQATNNLRLINKKFNSLIQEYINKQKELKPKVYANLTPAQAYKQFQLDLIDEKINEFITTRSTLDNDVFPYIINDLRAFKYIKNRFNSKQLDLLKKLIDEEIDDFVRNKLKKSQEPYEILIDEYPKIPDSELKKEIEKYLEIYKALQPKLDDSKIKMILRKTIAKKLFVEYTRPEERAKKALQLKAYHWLKGADDEINKIKEGPYQLSQHMEKLITNLELEEITALLNDKQLGLDPNLFLDENNKQILNKKITESLNNLDNLKKIHQIIKLLLYKGADTNLLADLITSINKNLKELESKMSYKAQYAGYGIPENVTILREIAKTLESEKSEDFKPVGKSWLKW